MNESFFLVELVTKQITKKRSSRLLVNPKAAPKIIFKAKPDKIPASIL